MPVRSRGAGVGVLALGLAVVACAPGADVTRPPTAQAELARQALSYAAASGPVLAVVVGDPLDRPDRIERTLEAANRGIQGLRVPFTTDPAMAAQPNLKLVLLVNPERPDDPAGACVDPEVTQEPPEPVRPTLLAVFCEDERPLAGTLGNIEVTGPDDPNYDGLVSQTTAALFPDDYWQRRPYIPFGVGVGVGTGGRTSVGVGVGVGF